MRATIANASESDWAPTSPHTSSFPPPLWGRAREGGEPRAPNAGLPPSPTLPHKGGGSLNSIRPLRRQLIFALGSVRASNWHEAQLSPPSLRAKRRNPEPRVPPWIASSQVLLAMTSPIHSDNNN